VTRAHSVLSLVLRDQVHVRKRFRDGGGDWRTPTMDLITGKAGANTKAEPSSTSRVGDIKRNDFRHWLGLGDNFRPVEVEALRTATMSATMFTIVSRIRRLVNYDVHVYYWWGRSCVGCCLLYRNRLKWQYLNYEIRTAIKLRFDVYERFLKLFELVA